MKFYVLLLLTLFASNAYPAPYYSAETLIGSEFQYTGPWYLWPAQGTPAIDANPFERHPIESAEEEVEVSPYLDDRSAILVFSNPIDRPFNWVPDRRTVTAARAFGGAAVLYIDGKRSDRPSRTLPIRTLPKGLWMELKLDAGSLEALKKSFDNADIPPEPCTLNVQDRLRYAGIGFLSGRTALPSILLGKILFGEMRRSRAWTGKRKIEIGFHLVGTKASTLRHFFSSLYDRDSDKAHVQGLQRQFLSLTSDAAGQRRNLFATSRFKGAFVLRLCSALLAGAPVHLKKKQ